MNEVRGKMPREGYIEFLTKGDVGRLTALARRNDVNLYWKRDDAIILLSRGITVETPSVPRTMPYLQSLVSEEQLGDFIGKFSLAQKDVTYTNTMTLTFEAHKSQVPDIKDAIRWMAKMEKIEATVSLRFVEKNEATKAPLTKMQRNRTR